MIHINTIGDNIDRKLEARIARLERMVNRKNEQLDEMSSDDAIKRLCNEFEELGGDINNWENVGKNRIDSSI